MPKKGKLPFSIFLFLLVPLLVLLVVIFKGISSKPTYVYVKIKVSQGLWWVTSNKTNIWFPTSIKKGEVETNLLGKPIAEVLEARYYPFFSEGSPYEDKFDIYLTLRVAADYNQKTGRAFFKRSDLSVGAPLELNLPSSQVSGTIIEVSPTEFKDTYSKRVIYLTKRLAYPWEYEAIKIGDTYFDGTEEVFKVISKEATNTSVISADSYGNLSSLSSEPTRYITVRVELKVKEKDGKLIFGEEKIIVPGSLLSLITSRFNFQDFVVSKIF